MWRELSLETVQTMMLDPNAIPLLPLQTSSSGYYMLTLRHTGTGQEEPHPEPVRAPLSSVKSYFPYTEVEEKVYPPSDPAVCSVYEFEQQQLSVVVTHACTTTNATGDTLAATLYSPWIPVRRSVHTDMTPYEAQHHAALSCMAKAEGWVLSEEETRGEEMRYKLKACWTCSKRERYAGDETIRSLLGLLPFLCPTAPVRYTVHALTNQIYWVDIRGLCGWHAVLQVNCCAKAGLLLRGVTPPAPCVEPLQSWPTLHLVPPRVVRVRLANSMRKAAASAGKEALIGLGEMQYELSLLDKNATELEFIGIGDRLLQMLEDGEAVDYEQLLRHLVMMFGGFLHALSDDDRSREAIIAGPTIEFVRGQQKAFWRRCRQTSPENWWTQLPSYPTQKEVLFHDLKTNPVVCSAALLPPSIRLVDVVAAAGDDIRNLPHTSPQYIAYKYLRCGKDSLGVAKQ